MIESARGIGLELDPDQLSKICRTGSPFGFASRVLSFCEQGLALVPDDIGLHYGRGLARALTGDFQGAILDFQFYGDHATEGSELVPKMRNWIGALKRNQNPFTPDVLDQLKRE
jgi:hypothetical protein